MLNVHELAIGRYANDAMRGQPEGCNLTEWRWDVRATAALARHQGSGLDLKSNDRPEQGRVG